MIRKSVIGILIFFSVISVSAQQKYRGMENKSPDESAEMITKKMTERLGLTDDQAKRTEEIYVQFFTKKKELEKEYPELKQAKEEFRALMEKERSRVKSILTEDQLQKMRSMKKVKHDGKPKRKGMDERMALMKEELALTAKQESELKEVFKDVAAKRKEIKSKYPELEEARKEMKTLKKDMMTQLKEVLTDEQFEKFQWSRQREYGRHSHGKRR